MLERPFSRPSLRQRSSTMTSLTSSHKSPTTSFNSAKSPDQISQETSFDHVPSWERPESAAKTLLSRGSRILKRQGSKFNLASTVPPNGDVSSDRQRKAVEIRELLHRAPKGRSKSATTKREQLHREFHPSLQSLTMGRRSTQAIHLGAVWLSACHAYPPSPFQSPGKS